MTNRQAWTCVHMDTPLLHMHQELLACICTRLFKNFKYNPLHNLYHCKMGSTKANIKTSTATLAWLNHTSRARLADKQASRLPPHMHSVLHASAVPCPLPCATLPPQPCTTYNQRNQSRRGKPTSSVYAVHTAESSSQHRRGRCQTAAAAANTANAAAAVLLLLQRYA